MALIDSKWLHKGTQFQRNETVGSTYGRLELATNLTLGGDLIVPGNLTVNGTTVTLNTEEWKVEDHNITLGNVVTPTDATANGGGITLLGTTPKILAWYSGQNAWVSNQDFRLSNGTGHMAFDLLDGGGASHIRMVTSGISYIGGTGVAGNNLAVGKSTADERVDVSGNVKATGFIGGGSQITALNAGNFTTGTLVVGRGGTGQTSFTNGQLLIGNNTGNTLTKATLTGGTLISITNGTGSITVNTSAEVNQLAWSNIAVAGQTTIASGAKTGTLNIESPHLGITTNNTNKTLTLSYGANTVELTHFDHADALSVIGNGSNAVASPQYLLAETDGHILRRSGTTLGFGTILSNSVSDFAGTVRSTTLTGLPALTNVAIVAGDTVLQAFAKTQGQIDAMGSSTSYSAVVNKLTVGATTSVTLSATPKYTAQVILLIKGGPNVHNGDDFSVTGTTLSWAGLGLAGLLETDDELTVFYEV